jgi:uncharacterized membrane protein SpoIIM required for sporulation
MSVASALTERAFGDRRRKSWDLLDALTRRADARGVGTLAPVDVAQFPALYRDVCSDLAAAEAARYSAPLVRYLRGLTAGAHGILYAGGASGRAGSADTRDGRLAIRHAWLVAFPRAVRRRWRAMLLSVALFLVPLAIGVSLTLHDPSFAFRIAPEATLRPLAEAYAKGFDAGREAGEGTMMAGYYVYNNVGIALRCFALGIFGGLGSAFYLVQNGLTIGAILGYVATQGAGANIGTFIVGHGSLELGAIMLSGGAGLSLGWSVVAPGSETRLASLQRTAREILVIVAGAAVMLLMAAGIEAFWSASSTPRLVKLVLGGTLFVLVNGYILLGGRDAASSGTR